MNGIASSVNRRPNSSWRDSSSTDVVPIGTSHPRVVVPGTCSACRGRFCTSDVEATAVVRPSVGLSSVTVLTLSLANLSSTPSPARQNHRRHGAYSPQDSPGLFPGQQMLGAVQQGGEIGRHVLGDPGEHIEPAGDGPSRATGGPDCSEQFGS